MRKQRLVAAAVLCSWWAVAGLSWGYISAAVGCETGWSEYDSETCSRYRDWTWDYTGGFAIR